ncbi:retrovirus-related pol polyprotein LINE-1, partial [Tanacetum coccineum]
EGQQVAPEIVAAHNAWIKRSKEIAGLMLMTMDSEIQRNLENLQANNMLKELKTLFAQQAEKELLQTTLDFHSCKQEEGQPFGPPPPASGGSPLWSDQDLGVGGYSQTRRVGRVASSRRIRVGSWNVGTLTGKFLELVDALRRKKVDIACFQETKWKGSRNREGNQYKLWYSGSANARNGVGVALAPNLKDKVVQVIRISDRIMLVRLVIEEETINVISAYAPQVGLGEAEKKSFWDSLDDLVRECSTTQQLIVAGDLNGHIGANADGFSSVHGGFGYGVRNEEGRSILEFAAAHDLVVVNSFFKKRDAHLITFHSGDHDTQIDYMLVRKGDLRLCKDCKVFPGEVCFSQHRLLALDIHIKRRPRSTERAVKPRILWKNLYGEAAEDFRARVIEGVTSKEEDRLVDVEQTGKHDQRGGQGNPWSGCRDFENAELISLRGEDEANRSAIEERYKEAKREAKKAVARAKEKEYKDLYKRLDSKEGENDIYRIAKARDRRKRDLGIVRFIKDEDRRSIVNEDAIRRRWKEYFSVLFNGQRSNRTDEVDSIGAIPQNNCYCLRIRHTEVKEALRKMGRNKAVGPDEILIEAWRCLGGEGVRWLTILFNKTFLRVKMPEEWRLREVIPIYKNKGDAQTCSNYRGIKLLSHAMKLWERVIERSIMEKYKERQKDLHLAFLDLEKAYGSVPRELIWKTLSDKGTPMRYIKFIQDMYEGARTCMRTLTGNTKYFPVDVGLHQGLAISPYLFALILDELTKGIQESIPWCLIFTDDIVLISETLEGLNRILKQWRKALEDNGILCDKKVPLKLKGKFYRVEIRPAMLYGSECWPLTKVQANRMEVAEMRMLRRPQSTPVRRVEPLTVNGARRRGGPKLRWEDRLKTDLKELLLSEDMTSDRSFLALRLFAPLLSFFPVSVACLCFFLLYCFSACLPASLLLCRYVPLSMPACLVLGFFACLLLSFEPVFRFLSRVVCFDALYLDGGLYGSSPSTLG